MSARRNRRARRRDNRMRRKLRWYRARGRRQMNGRWWLSVSPGLKPVSDRCRRLNAWAMKRAGLARIARRAVEGG